MKQNTARLKLTSLFKKALGFGPLPRSFDQSVKLMVRAGLPLRIFKYMPPLRRITFNRMDDKYLGVYFPIRLASTPGTENEEFIQYGWDGKPYMMIFGYFPEEWVILHEFAHYIDDCFLRTIFKFDKRRGRNNHPLARLNPGQVEEFCDLKLKMRVEYEMAHGAAKYAVTQMEGEETGNSVKWWRHISHEYVTYYAPSRYAFLTLDEWFAESFQTWCIHGETSTLPIKAPATVRFLQYLCSEKIFENVEQECDDFEASPLTFAPATAVGNS